jgi:peptidyl-prolyl cis-trans isomerase A (cyclophilin A)
MIARFAALALFATLSIPTLAAPPPPPAKARVDLQTSKGVIHLELDGKRAPITTANFLRYVDEKRFDGTTFYRASRAGGTGLIQGGIDHSYRRMLPSIAHEPTSKTGIKHVNGTISMARDAPGTATGDFFITVGANSYLDATRGTSDDAQGFAAFGHVIGGMDVVRKIFMAPTDKGGAGPMKGQMIRAPIQIITARRAK